MARPNYFVAIPITNDELATKIVELQDKLISQKLSPPWNGLQDTEVFWEAMTPPPKLHFTLKVMHLKRDQISRANAVFVKSFEKIKEELLQNPLVLDINGLGHFGTDKTAAVLFGQVKNPHQVSRLTKIQDMIQDDLYQHLDIPVDYRPFHPHLTIGKIAGSKKLEELGITAFPHSMWKPFENTTFGSQVVNQLNLFQMGASAGPGTGGGYKSIASCRFLN